MTDREAMQMALDVLQGVALEIDLDILDEKLHDRVVDAAQELFNTLAQPEQEHVAFMVYRGELCYKSQNDDQSFGMWCPVTQDLPFTEGAKFYTAPPQRKEWVGLTDEQKQKIEAEWNGSVTQLINTIEAAHNIKE